MTALEQLDNFYDFASRSLRDAPEVLSMDEIYQVWRSRHPADGELEQSIAALKSAHADLEAGQTGRPAREVLQEACRDLGLAIDDG